MVFHKQTSLELEMRLEVVLGTQPSQISQDADISRRIFIFFLALKETTWGKI